MSLIVLKMILVSCSISPYLPSSLMCTDVLHVLRPQEPFWGLEPHCMVHLPGLEPHCTYQAYSLTAPTRPRASLLESEYPAEHLFYSSIIPQDPNNVKTSQMKADLNVTFFQKYKTFRSIHVCKQQRRFSTRLVIDPLHPGASGLAAVAGSTWDHISRSSSCRL